MSSYRKIWVWGLWIDRDLEEWGWGAGGSGRGSEQKARVRRREGTAGRLTYKKVGKHSVEKNWCPILALMIIEQQKILKPGNTETTTVAQLRTIPSSCNKQGRWGTCAAPLKFATVTDILKHVFPLRSINSLSSSLRNAMPNCCREFSLQESFQTSGTKIHWSASIW